MIGEEWRVVAAAPYYEVSSRGRVRRIKGGVRGTYAGKFRKPVPDKEGYLTVTLSMHNSVTGHKVHRLVLLAFVGPQPPSHQSAHHDGDKTNNTLENLSWKTSKDNCVDKRRHGTHGMTLSASDVREIRRQRQLGGKTYEHLANAFLCSKGAIAAIVQRRTWAWL